MLKDTVAKNIRRLRKETGLSQEKFADKIGANKILVSRWEIQTNTPGLESVEKIALAFDKEPAWFLLDHESADQSFLRPSVISTVKSWLPKLVSLWRGEQLKNPGMEQIPDLLTEDMSTNGKALMYYQPTESEEYTGFIINQEPVSLAAHSDIKTSFCQSLVDVIEVSSKAKRMLGMPLF